MPCMQEQFPLVLLHFYLLTRAREVLEHHLNTGDDDRSDGGQVAGLLRLGTIWKGIL